MQKLGGGSQSAHITKTGKEAGKMHPPVKT